MLTLGSLLPYQSLSLLISLKWKRNKEAIGWSLADIKGIRPSVCMHRILLEDDSRPIIEAQRRLNPTMREVVHKEVLKWLDVRVIYPISDSPWVSPVQVVPKKGGMTLIKNETMS